MPRVFWIAAACLALGRPLSASDDELFEARIRPTLAGVCFRCHGDQKTSGGLRVDSLEALLQGGESGPAIIPGDPQQSLALRALRREDDVSAMPPGETLDPRIVADFAQWIAGGARWPAQTAAFRPARHWAFEPIAPLHAPARTASEVNPTLPADPASEPAEGAKRSPIDEHVSAALVEAGLPAAERADKRTLIRRATFDLTGLPPTIDEVEAFLADEAPLAFARVIDRLLASPRYGEQWGRHWLDVVRYADTAGETADFPVPDAWRYRNYVIAAFNADKPYDEFLREQLAGDLLARDLHADAPAERYAELLNATGFISVARRFGFDADEDHYLTIDDTLDMLGKAVLGLTVSCARCHDHKFDPISMGDYYGLYGIFASTRYPFPGCEKKPRPRDAVRLMPPWEYARRAGELDDATRQREQAKQAAEEVVRARWAPPAALIAAGQFDNGGAQEFAAASAAALESVSVRRGEMLALSILPRENQGADSTGIELVIRELGGGERVWNLAHDLLSDPLSANPHADALGHQDVWYFCDLAGAPALLTTSLPNALNTAGLQVWRGAGDTPSLFVNTAEQPIRFITVTMPGRSVGLHPGPAGGAAVLWRSPDDLVVNIAGRAFDLDAGGGDGVAWQIERRADAGEALLAARDVIARWNKAQTARTSFEAALEQTYAVQDGEPQNVRMHLRGDPKQLGDEAPRRFLSALGGQTVADSSGSGRRELADWLARGDHPLTARVIANRVWQYHFGAGLVRTPNDFGRRGEAPSHPGLLDYLASQLVADGWSLKTLHRRIMLSDAYQRASRELPAAGAVDPENRWLWRFARRRLTAEEIRDAMLSVCGQLDDQPGGAHPFPASNTWTFTQHNPFAGAYESRRRSVYLMVQRIRRDPFFALFDGADASASTGQRFTTTVPTQSLYFMNDPFVHQLAEALGGELTSLDASQRADAAARRLFARPAPEDERAAARQFVERYAERTLDASPAERERLAWSAWVRVQLGSNEFLYVD